MYEEDNNDFDPQAFIKIGESLDMPGEIEKYQLKRVPKKSWHGDARRPFFIENANSKKYYYMPIGDVPQHPHTLVPLGAFLGFINYRGQVPIEDNEYSLSDGTSYYMRFSNYPYNATDRVLGAISMEVDPLLYTDEPPVVPLTYEDYIKQFYPEQLSEITRRGGKKTRNGRNKKSKKTRKYKKRGKIYQKSKRSFQSTF